MELLPTLLGALPDLGVAGIVLVVLYVGQRLLSSEREYFRTEREAYRKEAREDLAALREELVTVKAENRELEERLNQQWRSTGPPAFARHRPRSPEDGG